MKYLYTFSEINYGAIEIEADHEPDNDEIIGKIHDGYGNFNDTDFTDFRLIEIDGEAHITETEKFAGAGSCPACGSNELEYNGSTLENSSYMYDWICEKCGTYGRECHDLIFSEHIIDSKDQAIDR